MKTFDLRFMNVITICFMLILLSMSMAYTQCPGLSMTVSYVPVQQLSVAEIDFQHFQSRNLLYTLNITNSGTTNAYASLFLSVHIKLADGTQLSDVTYRTKQFAISPGMRTLTNLDIGHNTQGIKDSIPVVIPPDVKSSVEDVALGTGKFPAGDYSFHLELDGASCQVSTQPIVFNLTNPSQLELRSPRDGETTNQFPLFEFYQDAGSATLTVAELTQNQSREDAITHQPPMLQVQLNGQNSFLYSGGRPLENGKTYVWQVVTKSVAVGGSASAMSSPIWSFQVSSDASTSSDDYILKLLQQMFGDRYASIFQQLQQDGCTSTGVFELNGTTITQSQLLNILNELRSNPDDVELSIE